MATIADLTSLGQFQHAKGGHPSGTRTVDPGLFGLKADAETRRIARMSITLIPSEDFGLVDGAVRRMYGILDRYAIDVPMDKSLRLRLVPNGRLEEFNEEMDAALETYKQSCEEFLTDYPRIVSDNREKVKDRLLKFHRDNVKGRDGALSEGAFEVALGRWLNDAYMSVERFKEKMYFDWGGLEIRLKGRQGEDRPANQVMEAMAQGLREEARDRIGKIATLIMEGKRLGNSSLDSAKRDLVNMLEKNVLGDEALGKALDKAVDILGSKDANFVKTQKTQVTRDLRELSAAIPALQNGEMEAMVSALETGGRILED